MDLYEELKKVKIPYIDNYVIIHPKYKWLVTNFQIWAKENKVDICRAITFDYCKMVAEIFPYCKSKCRLLNILLLTYMLFLIDDDMEKLVKSGNPQLLRKYFDSLSETLEYPEKITEERNETCILFGKIWLRFIEYFSYNQIKLLSAAINDWFVFSIFLQTNYRMKNRYIPVSKYFEYRRLDIMYLPYIYFTEYALEIELKDHIRETNLIKQLQILCLDRTILAHDIIAGLRREYINGEIMNYVFALKNEKQCSFQEAVDDGYLRIMNIDTEYKRCEQKIKSDSYLLAEQPMIMEYITALNILCYGFIGWNSKSVRWIDEHISVNDVNWIQLKENIEKNSEMKSHCYPPLKDIIGEKNALKYLI